VAYTGFQGTDTVASLTGTLVYGGSSQGAVNVGNYTIIPSGLSSSNYTITYVNGTLGVTPRRWVSQRTAQPASTAMRTPHSAPPTPASRTERRLRR